MTETDEKLAYLLDDYPGDSAEAAIDEAVADVNLQYQARRYRLIGEVMRHEVPWVIDTDFHNRVMAEVRAESPARNGSSIAVETETTVGSSWFDWLALKPVAGLAVAAAVAVVTVSLWQPAQLPGDGEPDKIVTLEDERIEQLARQSLQGSAAVPASAGVGTRWVIERDSPALQQKLNSYLVNHTEYSNSVQGIIPQARVAGFDAQQ